MDAQLIVGLGIVIITVAVISLLSTLVMFLLRSQSELGDWLFNQEGNHWLKLFMFFVWLALTIFKLCMVIVTVIAAIVMANQARNWWHKQ